MPGFMRARAVVVHWREERGKRRQSDAVIGRCIECPVSLMYDAGIDPRKELFSGFDALLDRCIRISLGRVAVHLCGIEYGITAGEQQTRTVRGMLFADLL